MGIGFLVAFYNSVTRNSGGRFVGRARRPALTVTAWTRHNAEPWNLACFRLALDTGAMLRGAIFWLASPVWERLSWLAVDWQARPLPVLDDSICTITSG